ncbi:hypothetical protein NLJ89_g4951 [Agrocybe chaxingu]|uniref:F-box domain-containing protein n=1 Tax=Agrocybe chaxingu TaxID=84603 RepID=A0A9W8K823_9AGAR|nr:hypothetical protein NLJ89_g4951 [Agrocybe chaxingu]
MTSQSSLLNDLLPEIFPIVASLLPLHATPSTLLSLALVNKHTASIVLPLVYSRLILKNEDDALKVIQKLLDEPELGKVVRELHILSDLSVATRNGERPFDVVRGLEKVIAAGSLPYIHTLGLELLTGWHYDDEFEAVEGFGELRREFWEALRKNCPRLRGLVLRDIADNEEDPWLEESGLLEIQDITSLTVKFKELTLNKSSGEKLVKSIASLSNSLHTLNLAPNSTDFVSVSPIFAFDFPSLRSLSLATLSLGTTEEAMAFWERHPTIEYLNIVDADWKAPWFTNNLPNSFLPRLKHLKAHFKDVRSLAPILHQLVSLTVYESINAQVPYLLRSVLPDGLPHLKALSIEQSPSASSKNVNNEGSLWYETAEGEFKEVKVHKGSRSVVDGYIHSIARGAPNIEELSFPSYSIDVAEFVRVPFQLLLIAPSNFESQANIADELAALSKLQRFYHSGMSTSLSDISEEEREAVLASVQILAEAYPSLTTVVDTSSVNLPFVTARIARDGEGKVSKVDLGTGYGVLIGNDDEAFPRL